MYSANHACTICIYVCTYVSSILYIGDATVGEGILDHFRADSESV